MLIFLAPPKLVSDRSSPAQGDSGVGLWVCQVYVATLKYDVTDRLLATLKNGVEVCESLIWCMNTSNQNMDGSYKFRNGLPSRRFEKTLISASRTSVLLIYYLYRALVFTAFFLTDFVEIRSKSHFKVSHG